MNNQTYIKAGLILLCLVLTVYSYTVPDRLPLEIRLYNITSGEVINDTYTINFSIYDDSSRSNLLCTHSQSVTFDENGLAGIYMNCSYAFSQDTWLCIDNTGGGETTDCMELGFVPYSKYTDVANTIDSTGNIATTGVIDASVINGTTLLENNIKVWTYDGGIPYNNLSISNNDIPEAKIDMDTVCAAGNHLYVSGNDFACEADDDTTYSAGNGISESSEVFSVAGNLGLTQDADGLSVTPSYFDAIYLNTSLCSAGEVYTWNMGCIANTSIGGGSGTGNCSEQASCSNVLYTETCANGQIYSFRNGCVANTTFDTDTIIGNCSGQGSCGNLFYPGNDETITILNVTGMYNFQCSAGDFVKNLSSSGGYVCDTPAGGGDITGVTTAGAYLLGGCLSGTCALTVNETVLNTTILNRLVSLYQQVVIVAKSGGDYTTIQGGIDSIADATADKRYAILIYPGDYNEQIVMEDYVDLVGHGRTNTRITHTGTNGTALTYPAIKGTVSDLGIYANYGAMTAESSAVVSGGNDSIMLRCDVTVTKSDGDFKMHSFSVTGGSFRMIDSHHYYSITMDGTEDSQLSQSVFIQDGALTTFLVYNSEITATCADTNDDLIGFETVTGGEGTYTLKDNIINIDGSGTSTTGLWLYGNASGATVSKSHMTVNGDSSYGMWVDSTAGGAVVNSRHNDIIVTGAGTKTSFHVESGDTINSYFDAIDATSGSSGAGTLNLVSVEGAGTLTTSGVISSAVGFDCVGNVDCDMGSADVDDFTFTTDGTGTAEIVLPAGAIDGTEIFDDTIDSADYAADSIDDEHINWGAGAGQVDLDDIADTNNLYQDDIGSDCGAGDFVKGVDDDGTLDCSTPAGGGDVTDVGDCTTGACFDGASGNVLKFEGTVEDVYELSVSAAELGDNYNWIFPDDEIADGDLIIGTGAGTFGYTAPDAGTNITADLEEEAHCIEHDGNYLTCDGEELDVSPSGVAGAIAEGELADSIILSADIKDGEVDISADSNLAVTTPIVLTDDNLSIILAKDIVAGTGLGGGENDVLPGADADMTLYLDWSTVEAEFVNKTLCNAGEVYVHTTGCVNNQSIGNITIDTNESTRMGNIASFTCSGTDKVSSFAANSTPVCTSDEDSGSTSFSDQFIISKGGQGTTNSTTDFGNLNVTGNVSVWMGDGAKGVIFGKYNDGIYGVIPGQIIVGSDYAFGIKPNGLTQSMIYDFTNGDAGLTMVNNGSKYGYIAMSDTSEGSDLSLAAGTGGRIALKDDVYTTGDFEFQDELLPDGDICNVTQILKRTDVDNWDCAPDDDVPESGDFGNAGDLEADGTLSADVVSAAEMADYDHGDGSWTSGVLTVENLQCSACVDISSETNLANGSGLLLNGDTMSANCEAITGGAGLCDGTDADSGATVLGDLATTSPITGAANDIFIGSDGTRATIGITVLKDIEAGVGLVGGENDVLVGADADTTINIDPTYFDGIYLNFTKCSAGEVYVYSTGCVANNTIGSGSMTSFDIYDGTTTETIVDGDTITFSATGDGVTLVVSATDTVTANVDVSDFAGTGLQDDGSENLRIATTAAGNGLIGGGGSALSVNVGHGLTIDNDFVNITFADNIRHCYGNDCDACEYWNGTHKIDESPCSI